MSSPQSQGRRLRQAWSEASEDVRIRAMIHFLHNETPKTFAFYAASRSVEIALAIVDRMHASERKQFYDALPACYPEDLVGQQIELFETVAPGGRIR
jgi:hypothetical protein